MQRFSVVKKTLGSICADFFHDPEDVPLSIQEYLEDKFADGWELSQTSDAANGPYWIFKAVGRNS